MWGEAIGGVGRRLGGERRVAAGSGKCWGLSEEEGSESRISEFKHSHWEFPSSLVVRIHCRGAGFGSSQRVIISARL